MPNFFSWDNIFFFLPRVLSALPTTLLIVGVATVLGLILGLLLAFARLENIPFLKQVCAIFVSYIRGTPILVQMFIVYYALPMLLLGVGIDITRWEKLYFIFITYGLNTGAYFSEIIRASILSVPRSQKDAAAAVGLTKVQAYYRIIIPQSAVIAIPSLGTSVISLLQDTSLAFSLGIMDVIGKVRSLGALTTRVLEGYIDAALVFVALTIILEKCFGYLETKTRGRPV